MQALAGVLTAKVLVDLVQPRVPVQLLNVSDKHQFITKGLLVAKCEPVQLMRADTEIHKKVK